jgi:hypothetical protein
MIEGILGRKAQDASRKENYHDQNPIKLELIDGRLITRGIQELTSSKIYRLKKDSELFQQQILKSK